MIYKLPKLAKQRFFSEQKLCFMTGPTPAPEGPEAPEFNLQNHIQSLNEGRRDFAFRANLTREFLQEQTISQEDFKNILVRLGVAEESTQIDLNNDEQLVN